MLDTPDAGWSKIRIGSWSERCSYLDDVPTKLLRSLICSCKEHEPIATKFDAEGWEYIVLVDWQQTYIIDPDDEDCKFRIIDVNRDNLAMELINDVRKDIDKWVSWPPIDMEDKETEVRRNKLLELCLELERTLPSDDYHVIYRNPEAQ